MVHKVGIISANWGAFAHLPAWRSLKGVEVTAICTSRQETAEGAAARFGIDRAFWNAAEMAADPDLDIIDIGTRPTLRRDMVLDALRHGKHVYNGVPMAAGLAAARDMHRAWRGSGRVAVVDAFSQWIPQLRLAKEMLDQGHIGDPVGGSCRFNMALFNVPNPQFPYNWFSQEGTGVSSMRNNGSHLLHYLDHMLGPIAELVADDSLWLREWVFADGERLTAHNNDRANLILKFVNGTVMPIQVCWTAAVAEGWAVDIWGSKGRLLSRSPTFPSSREATLYAGRLGGSLAPVDIPDRLKFETCTSLDWTAPIDPTYPMALAMHSMIGAIEGQGRAHRDFEHAFQVERVQEAIRLSSAERRWIKLEDVPGAAP